jgi:hypothetical protein
LTRNFPSAARISPKGDYAAAIAEGHKAEKMKPHDQLVHTNLSRAYMKTGDKKTAEHHALQARIASWRGNMAPPGAATPTEPELEMAKPKPPPVMKLPENFPTCLGRRNRPIYEIRLRTGHGTFEQNVARGRQIDRRKKNNWPNWTPSTPPRSPNVKFSSRTISPPPPPRGIMKRWRSWKSK